MEIKKGLIIVFTGVDGSGKSTLTKNTFLWLKNNNYKAKKIYLGSGKGQKNMILKISDFLTFFGYKLKKNQKYSNKNDNNDHVYDEKKITFFKKPLLYTYYLIRSIGLFYVVIGNYKKIKKMYLNKNKGIITITDRFPQSQYKNINDGPKLERYAIKLNNRFLSRLASKEKHIFNKYSDFPPDIVFKLMISPEVAITRKPEHSNLEYFTNKINLVNKIDFPSSKIIEVDAENTLENVVIFVRTKIIKELKFINKLSSESNL
jgi:thymidylate kinase